MDHPKFIDADGIRTRYFDAGQGEPLVMIHGGTYGSFYNAEDWELNFDGLAEHFRVIAYDRIGLGFTDNPRTDADYVIGSSVDHAHALIRALGLGPAHIMGHSRGGYTAARLVLEHPEVCDTLIIVDSSSLMTPANPQYEAWDREAQQYADLHERMRYLVTANSYGGDHITPRYLDVAVEIDQLPKTAVAKQKMAGLGPRFKSDLVERQQETHAWIRAGRLQKPTLVMWAYEDPSATMDRCGIPCMNLIMPNVQDAEMVILNHAGHMVYRERPEPFNHAVIDFIGRHRAGRRAGVGAAGAAGSG
jgi:2-hydroxy-6-oxo-6-(2'-carboxyphenyl)-hexa-2,4-dienoate hydrolase